MPVTTVYTLSHPETGEVRYVGKTAGNLKARLSGHVAATKKGRVNHRTKWIGSLLDQGLKPVIKYVDHIVGTDEHGSWLEVEWISLLGASGRLTNATAGGEGATGYVPTEEAREKNRASQLGRKHSDETRAKIRDANTGRKFSAEHLAKLTASNRGRRQSAEHVAKRTAKVRGQKRGPMGDEQRARLSAMHTGMKQSAETIAKRVAKVKATWAARRQQKLDKGE